jgi:hypothetical protein
MTATADAVQARFYPFSERPLADSCWSLHTGPDGRVYAAACIEHTGGQSVTVVRYDEGRDGIEYLFDMDEVTGDLRDSGRATQCKIHYSFAPSGREGLLYCATHLSGPPIGERRYCPWSSWHDERRAFRGAYVAAFDTRTDRVAWTALMIPREGCRCLCLDEERGRLYAVSYPRDHFIIFDLATRTSRDLGRIGSVNTQCLFLDGRGRVYLTDDHGRFVRYDPGTDALETLPLVFPHEAWQTGWHAVLYDAVADPARPCVYMVPWMVRPHLARFWPEEGPHGRLEDLGALTQRREETHPLSMSLDHVGGLVFGADGGLYLVRAAWPEGAETATRNSRDSDARGVVTRIDPETLERKDVCTLVRDGEATQYVSRGARDHAGNLYFAHVGRTPVGLFRVTFPGAGDPEDAHRPLRVWG